jgi:hypothetical protein
MPEDEDVIDQLMRAMRRRTEDSADDELKTVFREFTTELRKLNEGMAGDRASQEQIAEHEDLSRRYPALKTKPPRPRRRAS